MRIRMIAITLFDFISSIVRIDKKKMIRLCVLYMLINFMTVYRYQKTRGVADKVKVNI